MKLFCPQCGGENHLEAADLFFKCTTCQSSLYVDLDNITASFSFKPLIESEEVKMHLRRDFDKTGFNEKIEIRDITPVYIPFWQSDKTNILERASSHFPGDLMKVPTGEKIFFDSKHVQDKAIRIMDIETQPKGTDKQNLFFVPFFEVTIIFNNEKYAFYVCAVNGEVRGEPIPFISSAKTFKFFPLFIAIFAVFLLINILFNNMAVALMISLVFLFLAYWASLSLIEKKYYKKV